jgi:predicted GTPase
MTTINEFLLPLSVRARNVIIRMVMDGYNYRLNKVYITVKPVNRDADIMDAFGNLTVKRLGYEEACGLKTVQEITKAFAKHGLILKAK